MVRTQLASVQGSQPHGPTGATRGEMQAYDKKTTLLPVTTSSDAKAPHTKHKKTTLLPVTTSSDAKAPRTTPSAELNWVYTIYVTYEAILINLVGFFTLIFQCELQDLAATIEAHFPWIPKLLVESATGHYWLQGDLNCSTPSARCLTYMVAGW